MKKFFSLVLALVMALSLTTVAWGASALPAADGSGVVTLAANTEYSKITALDPAVTKIVGATGATVAGIEISGAVSDLILENVTFTADVYFAGGNVTNLTVNECTFNNASLLLHLYPTYTVTNLVVTDCEFNGYNTATPGTWAGAKSAIYVQNVTGATITGNTITNAQWNGIQLPTENNGPILIENNTISNTGSRSMRLAIDAGTLTVKNNKLSNANLAEENADVMKVADSLGDKTAAAAVAAVDAATGNTYDNVAVGMNEVGVAATTEGGKYTSGVFFTDPTGSVAEGYVAVKTGPYSWSVVPASGSALTATKYDMVTTDAAATKTVGVTVVTYAAKAPKDTNKDGLLDQDGNVKYVVFSNLPGKTFVQVNTVGEADYTVYQTGTKTLFGYFNEVASPFYKGNGVAFYDFGEKCGQYDDEPTIGAKYYLFQGVLYKAVTTSGTNLMVGNVLTPVEALADKFVDHVPAFTYDKTYKVVGVKCGECGTDAVLYANYASVPKADKGVAEALPGGQYYVWLAGPVADTETKVESAATFDAGIAMYVGMSVMAAAGSAVVIGKKKD